MFAGYKTMIVNAVVMVFGLITAFSGPIEGAPDAEDVGLLVDSADGLIVALIGLVNIILRAVTRTPVFWKKSDEA